ncbi:MAG: hypothetical protein BWY25_03291 [Chloroflexi bacterium ADurb.Bin222]|nr:MAG: hypothetical protein BWY25_03291 [Chloroflexi bacterium ADurb.Bin222]
MQRRALALHGRGPKIEHIQVGENRVFPYAHIHIQPARNRHTPQKHPRRHVKRARCHGACIARKLDKRIKPRSGFARLGLLLRGEACILWQLRGKCQLQRLTRQRRGCGLARIRPPLSPYGALSGARCRRSESAFNRSQRLALSQTCRKRRALQLRPHGLRIQLPTRDQLPEIERGPVQSVVTHTLRRSTHLVNLGNQCGRRIPCGALRDCLSRGCPRGPLQKRSQCSGKLSGGALPIIQGGIYPAFNLGGRQEDIPTHAACVNPCSQSACRVSHRRARVAVDHMQAAARGLRV